MSKKLAQLIFEKSGKAKAMPEIIHPVYAGKELPAEHLAYVNDKEMSWLRAKTDGKSDTTQFGPESFVDPSGAYGGDLSGTQTKTNYNGSGSNPTSSSYDHGGGTNPSSYNNGATSGYSGVSSSNDHGNPTGGFAYAPARTAPSVVFSGNGGSSNGTGAAGSWGVGFGSKSTVGSFGDAPQAVRDAAWNHVMGTSATSDRVTVASVPAIPSPVAAAPVKVVSYADSPSLMAAAYRDYRSPPGAATVSAVPNRDRLNGANPDSGVKEAFNDPLSGIKNPDVRFSDPRAGYYDQNGVTQETQFANRLRESLQLQGLKPNDTAIAGVMGNLQNENLPAYMKPGNNPWSIDSPSAFGKFVDIKPNKDSAGTFSGGVAQWNSGSGRLQQAQSFFKGNGLNPNDPNNQAAALAAEVAGRFPGQTGNYSDTYKSLSGMSVPDSTKTWMSRFEAPAAATNHLDRRIASAQDFSGSFPSSTYQDVMRVSPMAPQQAQVSDVNPFYGAKSVASIPDKITMEGALPSMSATAAEEVARRAFANNQLPSFVNDGAMSGQLLNQLGNAMWQTRINDATRVAQKQAPTGNYGEVSPSPWEGAGFRTAAQAAENVDNGTGVPINKTFHGMGLAADVSVPRMPGESEQAWSNRNALVNQVIASNINPDTGVTWGGTWKKSDPSHFQLGQGSKLAEAIKQYGSNVQVAGIRPPGVVDGTQVASSQAANPLVAALVSGLSSPKAPTLAGFATPAVGEPPAAAPVPDQVAAVDPNVQKYILDSQYGQAATELGNYIHPYVNPDNLPNQPVNHAPESHGGGSQGNGTTAAPVTTPAVVPPAVQQYLNNPLYSTVQNQISYVVDGQGKYWMIDPKTGQYTPAPTPMAAA